MTMQFCKYFQWEACLKNGTIQFYRKVLTYCKSQQQKAGHLGTKKSKWSDNRVDLNWKVVDHMYPKLYNDNLHHLKFEFPLFYCIFHNEYESTTYLKLFFHLKVTNLRTKSRPRGHATVVVLNLAPKIWWLRKYHLQRAQIVYLEPRLKHKLVRHFEPEWSEAYQIWTKFWRHHPRLQ